MWIVNYVHVRLTLSRSQTKWKWQYAISIKPEQLASISQFVHVICCFAAHQYLRLDFKIWICLSYVSIFDFWFVDSVLFYNSLICDFWRFLKFSLLITFFSSDFWPLMTETIWTTSTLFKRKRWRNTTLMHARTSGDRQDSILEAPHDHFALRWNNN